MTEAGTVQEPGTGGRGRKRMVHLCVPTLGSWVTGPLASMLNQAGMLSLVPGHPWFYNLMMPVGRRPVEFARNLCVAQFLEDDRADRLFFIDDDMVPPTNWWKLLEHDAPIVSGITFGWQAKRYDPPREPMLNSVIFDRSPDGLYRTVLPKSEQPFEVDAAGAACMVIRKDLIKRMEPPWFKTVYADPMGNVDTGEDVWFCRKANALGAKVLVDPGIAFGHSKDLDILDVARYGSKLGAGAGREAGGGEQDQMAEG